MLDVIEVGRFSAINQNPDFVKQSTIKDLALRTTHFKVAVIYVLASCHLGFCGRQLAASEHRDVLWGFYWHRLGRGERRVFTAERKTPPPLLWSHTEVPSE